MKRFLTPLSLVAVAFVIAWLVVSVCEWAERVMR